MWCWRWDSNPHEVAWSRFLFSSAPFYSYCCQRGLRCSSAWPIRLLSHPVASVVEVPKPTKKEIRPLNHAQVSALFEAAALVGDAQYENGHVIAGIILLEV